MPIVERSVGDVTVVDVSGKLTLTDGAGQLKDKINSLVFTNQKRIVLNLSGLTSMDSTGLGELVACYTTVTRAGGAIKLACLGHRVHDLLVMSKLLTVFDTFDSEAGAIASF
jgi:anti-sigma B factor antagonist